MKRTMALALLSVITGSFFAGCSSTGVKQYQRDEILSTANDKSQPDWADETKPFQVKDGKVQSVGLAYIKGDERPDAGARISANNARSNIAKAVENRMEFIFQNAEEGLTYDNGAAKFIGSEVSSITTNHMRESGMWWARVAQSDEDGSRKIRYKIYSLVEMDESEFKKAINKAIEKASGQKKLSPGFQKQVDSQWSRFVEGQGSEGKTTSQ